MTNSRTKSRNIRRYIPPPLPEGLNMSLDSTLRWIVRSYQSTIATMPADLLGAAKNPMREVFVARQVERWMAKGPECLSYTCVQILLNTVFSEVGFSVLPGQDFWGVLVQIIRNGLTMELEVLLCEVEMLTFEVSDEFLKDLGLTDDGVEIFQGLLPSYSGTLDELVETAGSL